MYSPQALVLVLLGATSCAIAQSTEGIYSLVKRRMPEHANSFQFSLVNVTNETKTPSEKPNDRYIVSTSEDGKIQVEGNSLSALSSG